MTSTSITGLAVSSVLDRVEDTLTMATLPVVSVPQRAVMIRAAVADLRLAGALLGDGWGSA